MIYEPQNDDLLFGVSKRCPENIAFYPYPRAVVLNRKNLNAPVPKYSSTSE